MKRPTLYQALLSAFLALSVGGLAAQTGVTSSESPVTTGTNPSAPDQTSAKQEPAAQPNQEQMKTAPQHTTKAKSHSHTAKAKSHSHTAKAKSHTHTAKAKSPQHTARTKTEESSSPEEHAYRQALRGCVTQKDESQRDTCLDQTIEKFRRNA